MSAMSNEQQPPLLAGAAGRAALAVASILIALSWTAIASAQHPDRTGKEVVDSLCISCHGTGANGAPKIGDKKAWAARSAQGLSSLTQHALNGIRQMPPHGGNPALSDTEIERAITYMVNQSGGHWTEPISRTEKTADRTGEAIVKAQCVKCHETGVERRAEDRRPGRLDSARQAGPRRRRAIGDQGPWRDAAARRHGRSHRRRDQERRNLHDELRRHPGEAVTRR